MFLYIQIYLNVWPTQKHFEMSHNNNNVQMKPLKWYWLKFNFISNSNMLIL